MALKVAPRICLARSLLTWNGLMLCSCSSMSAAHAYGGSGSSAEFESAIQSLKNRLQPARLIRVLDSASDLNLALSIFRWASHQKRFDHTAETYALMISKLGVFGNHDEMEELLKEMVKLEFPGLEQTLNNLVQFLCKNNRFDEALLVIQHASAGKLKLSITACNAVLCGFVKEGRGFRSFVLAYMEIVKAEILPDVETLNQLIEVLCEAGHLDLALNQLDRMSKKRCTPNSRTFEILITGLCSCGRVDESVKLLDKMLQLRCIPDSCFYAQVMPLFCELNKFEEATKLHRMMKEDGLQLIPHLYTVLIRCLSENQQLDNAIGIFKEMMASGHAPMSSTYANIVDCYCTLGKFHKAMSFLEEYNVVETEPYNVLLRALCKTGRLQDAVSYLEEFHDRGLVDSNSWNIFINQFCKEGNIRRTSELVGRMIVSSFTPDGSTFSCIASCYCQLGLYNNALDMFRSVSISNLCLNSDSFSQLVEGLCHMKRIQEAIEVFDYHCKRGCSLNSESLDVLIQESCLAGRIYEAIRMRSLAVSAGISCTFYTYNTIIQMLLHLKKEKDVLLLFAHMLMEGCILDEHSYNVLLRCFCTKNTIFVAAMLFNRMVNDGFVPDQETLELLVPDMASFSLLNMVAQSLSEVINIDGLMSPRICNIIVYGLLKEGFNSEACKFLDQMLEKRWVPDSKTHRILVGSIGQEETREFGKVYQTVDDDNVGNILVEGLN